jgi:hypothetical protein
MDTRNALRIATEGCDRQPVLLGRPDGVDRGLGAIEVFGCFGPDEQGIEEAFQVSFRADGQLNDKARRPSFLRLACIVCALRAQRPRPLSFTSDPAFLAATTVAIWPRADIVTPAPNRAFCNEPFLNRARTSFFEVCCLDSGRRSILVEPVRSLRALEFGGMSLRENTCCPNRKLKR